MLDDTFTGGEVPSDLTSDTTGEGSGEQPGKGTGKGTGDLVGEDRASTNIELSASDTVGDSRSGVRGERDEPCTLAVGERFAGFQIRGFLGHGAMGVVYDAWDPTLERRVALKLLRSPSKRAADRLLREAKALARLDHPGVVRIWAAEVHRGAVYIAMELIEGQNLREWLTTQRGWAEVLPVMIGAGRGLAAAHAACVIHRDFKPENVLVGWDGQARVLDFGIARISANHPEHLTRTMDDAPPEELGEREADDAPLSGSFAALPSEDPMALTEAGALIGTLLYMAPEQHSRERADERSDQFAFCTTLFEALYGAHPFPAKTRSELIVRAAEGEVVIPEGARGQVPRWLEKVILRGLSPNRDDRFATMEDLIDALERYPSRRRKRNRLLTIAAVVGSIGALVMMIPRAESADPCVDVARELDDALGVNKRREITERFAKLGTPWAEAMGRRVNSQLEAWSGRWIEARVEVCSLRHAHREATALDDRREACLAEQLAEVGALGAVLTHAQQHSLANAEQALTALPRPERCLDDEPPVGRATAGVDPELVNEQYELEWLTLTGGDSRTVLRATTLVAKVRELPRSDATEALLAIALVTLAEAKLLGGERHEAELLLREAIRTAERIGADGSRARAMVDLGWTLATTPGRAAEALVVLEDAAALLERVGTPPFEWQRQRQALGEALLASGDLDGAQRVLEAMLGDDNLGSSHATTLLGLSRVAKERGEHEQSLEHAEAALEAFEVHGPDSPLLAGPLINMGVALTNLGRLDEGRDALRRGIDLRRAQLAFEPGDGSRERLAGGLLNLAVLESKAGRSEVAAKLYAETLETVPEGDLGTRSLALFNLGIEHQIAGRMDEALSTYQDALHLAEQIRRADHPQVVGARLGVGSMLVALGRHGEAREPLERCLADWPKSMNGKADEAELRFALAQVLAVLDGWSERAEELAGEAAASYRRLGFVDAALEVEAWLMAGRGK